MSNSNPTSHAEHNEKPQELQKSLENRHLQLIAIGGSIGSGLFMGSGRIINLSGTSIIITYAIVGVLLFFVMRAMGELLLSNRNYRSFADFTRDYIGPWTAFFIGWTYWLSWIVVCVLDVVVLGGYMQYWYPDLPLWIPAFGFLGLIFLINTASVKVFGEVEFWFSLIKVIAILALIGTGLWMCLTHFVSPNGVVASYGHVFEKDAFIPNGWVGFLAGFQIVFFAFNGIELVGIAAAETKNPETTLPKAINSIPVRVLLFYVLSVITILAISSYHYISPDKSPFVELFALAGLPIAAAIINFVVMTATLSSANSGVFSTSRMLFGLSMDKFAPTFFTKLSKKYVPLRGLCVSSFCMFIGLCLLLIKPSVMELFIFLSTIAAIMMIFIWSLVLLSYLIYRKQRPDLHHKSIFKMPAGVILSYICLLLFFAELVVMFIQPDTRTAMYIVPIWFIWLGIIYNKFKKDPPLLEIEKLTNS